MASYKDNMGWSWVERTKTLSREGLGEHTSQTYPNIYVQFTRSGGSQTRDGDGTYLVQSFQITVASQQIIDLGITPNVHNSYLTRGTNIYRVVNIVDYSDMTELLVYQLRVERVEDFAN